MKKRNVIPVGALFTALLIGLIYKDEVRFAERINHGQFLIRLGTSPVTITVVSALVGAILARAGRRLQTALGGSIAREVDDDVSPFPNAKDLVESVPGTCPEYTLLNDYYLVLSRLSPR